MRAPARKRFNEFTGDGLQPIARALDRAERLLAILGSRLLEGQKRATETAEALSIRNAGEHSIITALARSWSASLTLALKWMHWWNSTLGNRSDAPVSLKLNTDYESGTLSGSLTALEHPLVNRRLGRKPGDIQ